MKKNSLRRTALFTTLLRLSTPSAAQSTTSVSAITSWGEPFSVAGPSSTENLIAPASSASSVVSSQEVSSTVIVVSTGTGSVETTSSTRVRPVPLDSTSTSTSVEPSSLSVSDSTGSAFSTTFSFTTTSAVSSASFVSGSVSTTGASQTTASAASESTGGVPAATGYVKMGVVGAIAGAAGVFVL